MIQRRDKKRTASAKRIQAAFLEENHIDIEEIPPKEEYVRDTVNKQLRVCAYCRVSTDEESQQSSYELQVQHYTEYINKHDNWTLVGVYADEGISGTSVNHRVQFLQMIQDAEDGKIDMIVTKSISRFARNTLDCISYVRRLKALKPPVGVFFEMNGYNTLDTISETFLTLLSTVSSVSADTIDDFDEEKAQSLMSEKNELQNKLEELYGNKTKKEAVQSRLQDVYAIMDGLKNHQIVYNDELIRQIIEVVIVESKEKIKIIFKGGLTVEGRL